MKIMKKIAAALLAAVMAVTAFAVTASADSIYDTAKEIKSGVAVTATGVGVCENTDYKIKVTKSGKLSLNLTIGMDSAKVYVLDSDGNGVKYSDYQAVAGSSDWSSYNYFKCRWNSSTEKIKLKADYSVQKGTYYIRIEHDTFGNYGNRKINLTATFPSATVSKAKISYLTLKVSKGAVAELGTVMSGSGKVEWTSSKASVASVNSNGRVTAKAKGSAIITAKCGTSKQKIKIIVK